MADLPVRAGQDLLRQIVHLAVALDAEVAAIDAEMDATRSIPASDRRSEQLRRWAFARKWSRDLRFVAATGQKNLGAFDDPGFLRDVGRMGQFLNSNYFAIDELQALAMWMKSDGRPEREVVFDTAKVLIDVGKGVRRERDKATAELAASARREERAVNEWRRTHPSAADIMRESTQRNFDRQIETLKNPPWLPRRRW